MNLSYIPVVFLIATSISFAGTTTHLSIGDNMLNLAKDKYNDIRVVISVEKFDRSGKNCAFETFSWWGADEKPPKILIQSIKILTAEKEQFFPRSSYDYLGNPDHAELKRESTGLWAINLWGGDAGTSYQVSFRFRGNALIERVVRSGEFPDQVWEKTVYKNFWTEGNKK